MAAIDVPENEAQDEWGQTVELRQMFGQACDGKSSEVVGRALSLMVADVIWQNSGDMTDTRLGLEAFMRDVERVVSTKGDRRGLQ